MKSGRVRDFPVSPDFLRRQSQQDAGFFTPATPGFRYSVQTKPCVADRTGGKPYLCLAFASVGHHHHSRAAFTASLSRVRHIATPRMETAIKESQNGAARPSELAPPRSAPTEGDKLFERLREAVVEGREVFVYAGLELAKKNGEFRVAARHIRRRRDVRRVDDLGSEAPYFLDGLFENLVGFRAVPEVRIARDPDPRPPQPVGAEKLRVV